MATQFSNLVAGFWIDETQSFTSGGDNLSISKDGTGKYHLDYSTADFAEVPIVLVTGEDDDNGDGMRCASTENHSSTACTIVLSNSNGTMKNGNLNILVFTV